MAGPNIPAATRAGLPVDLAGLTAEGCPIPCAQHQIGDIGLAGSQVRVDGRTTAGPEPAETRALVT